jgi:hypothetical protein
VKCFISISSRDVHRVDDIHRSGPEHKQADCAGNRRKFQIVGQGAKFGRKKEEAIAARRLRQLEERGIPAVDWKSIDAAKMIREHRRADWKRRDNQSKNWR